MHIEGNTYKAMVYYRSPKPLGKPSKEYRDIVVNAAKRLRLLEDYIKT